MRKYKFKVVKRRSNRSCMINGHSNFSILYEKETAVYADPDTLGIMVFKTKQQAEKWMNTHNSYGSDLIIKRVIPIGRGKAPKYISADVGPDDIRAYYELSSIIESNLISNFNEYKIIGTEVLVVKPIPGTICYPGVYVVD